MSVLVDLGAGRLADAERYWSAMSGTRVGEPVGDDDELWPLRPPHGDVCLWLQRTLDGPGDV